MEYKKVIILENEKTLPKQITDFFDYRQKLGVNPYLYQTTSLDKASHSVATDWLYSIDYIFSSPTLYRPSDINLLAHTISHKLRDKFPITLKGVVLFDSKERFLKYAKYLNQDALSSIGGILDVCNIPIYFIDKLPTRVYDSPFEEGEITEFVYKEIEEFDKLTVEDLVQVYKSVYDAGDSNVRFGRHWITNTAYLDLAKANDEDKLIKMVGACVTTIERNIRSLEYLAEVEKNKDKKAKIESEIDKCKTFLNSISEDCHISWDNYNTNQDLYKFINENIIRYSKY